MPTIDMQDTNRRGACAAPAVDEKPEAACALSGGSVAGTDVCREFRAGSAGFLGRRADCLPTGSYVFDPSIHHLTRNACHFIGCPIHGEGAE